MPLRGRSSTVVQDYFSSLFLLFCVKISPAEHLYVRWKVLYMRCLCFELHTVALTQSMSVHYSQRKNIYFTAKMHVQTSFGILLYNTLLNKSHLKVFVCFSQTFL